MIGVVVTTNALEIIEDFEKGNDAVRKEMQFAMFRALTLLKSEVMQNIRARSGLNVQTGTLLNSIQFQITPRGPFEIEGVLGPSNVPYAAAREFGAIMPARFIKPRLKQVLHWKMNGVDYFSTGHWMPSYEIPARPYLGPAVDAQEDNIAQKFGIFLDAIYANRPGGLQV